MVISRVVVPQPVLPVFPVLHSGSPFRFSQS